MLSFLLAVLPIAAPVSAGETWLHCGRLLAVPGSEPVSEVTLVVRDGRVAEVLQGYLLAPSGIEIVDLTGAFVMPGLIDCHTHITLEYSRDVRLERVERSDADQAIRAVVFAERTLLAGFTTIRDVGSSGDAVFALRDAIEEGLVPGPRILAGGESLSPSGGHSDPTHGYREDLFELPAAALGVCDGVAECRKAVRVQVKRGADVIKLTATGGVLSATNAGTAQQFFEDELEAIVSTAHALGRKVAAHAHGADGIKAALRAGVDSIEHGSFLDPEAVELFKETGAYLVPTLLAGQTVVEMAREEGYFPAAVRLKARQVGPVMIGALGMAHKAGVNIAFGTDSGVSRHGDNWREFPLMEKAGMSAMEILVTATINAADLCDLSDQIGTLEQGKRADVIALQGDPLQSLDAMQGVVFVMRDGVIYTR
ncbi:MAG: amidohydrolase family protein [Planctomycetota bacterium]|nr:amidohydrolase family protein [Planctomycetota bacterium]